MTALGLGGLLLTALVGLASPRGSAWLLGLFGLYWAVLGGLGWAEGVGAGAFYLLLLGLLALALSPYLPEYLEHHPEKARAYAFLVPLFVAALAGVSQVPPGYAFLFLWEGMALLGYFLIALEGAQALPGAQAFFLASRLSGIGLYLAFLGQGHLARDLVWLGLVLGFGVKAALFPFHGWLPRAHPVAISPVSALLSGAMTKLGLLGLYQAAFWFGPPPAWVGPLLLLLGLSGAVYALVRGLAEEDLKGALAYSSVENLGLMLAALGGFFLTGASLFKAAFFLHQLVHALFKALLFLGAGALEERRLSHLGGLWREAPALGALFLVGMGVAAGLPPGPLFLAEWALYLGLAQGPAWLPLGGGALALVGALALHYYVRLFGLAFLGVPRGPIAVRLGPGMGLALRLLAGFLFLVALAPEALLRPLGVALYPSGPLLLLFLALGYLLLRRLEALPSRVYGTWDCGYQPLTSRMQPNGLGFSQPVLHLFPFVRLREGERPSLEEPLEALFQGVGRLYGGLARGFQGLQSGSLHFYLLLQLLTLVLVLGVVLL